MTGTYLKDLFVLIKDQLPQLNLNIAAQGLTEFQEITDEFIKKTLRKTPFILIDLMGNKQGKIPCQDYEYEVIEDVPLKIQAFIRKDERDVILYEGILKSFIKGLEHYLQEGITDAQLVALHYLSANMTIDTDFKNADTFRLEITFLAKFCWG